MKTNDGRIAYDLSPVTKLGLYTDMTARAYAPKDGGPIPLPRTRNRQESKDTLPAPEFVPAGYKRVLIPYTKAELAASRNGARAHVQIMKEGK